MRILNLLGATLLLITLAIPARSKPSSSNHLDLNIHITHAGDEFTISGTADFHFLKPGNKCFYIPFSDKSTKATYEPLKHLEAYINKGSGEPILNPSTEVLNLKEIEGSFLNSHILKIDSNHDDSVKINFKTKGSSKNGNILFNGFYPLPLSTCDQKALANNPQFLTESMPIKVISKNSSNWLAIGPGPGAHKGPIDQEFSIDGDRFSLILVKNIHLHELHENLLGFKVHLYFRNPIKGSLIRTIFQALRSHQKWFSSYPYQSLTIVETENLLTADLPGLIAINQPRQLVFNYLQDSLLNWKHWVLSTLLAAQWYGASTRVYNPEDFWLLGGICDFATLMFLKADGSRFNLFNNYDSDFNWLSLNYLQVQDMTASLLFKDLPYMALTDSKLQTKRSGSSQNPLLFIKQALTMRYLRSMMGPETLQNFLQAFTRKYAYKSLKPLDFYTGLRDLSYGVANSGRQRIAHYLKSWWSLRGWPDYSIDEFSKTQLSTGKWLAKAVVKSHGNFELPTQVRFEDKGGSYYYVTSKQPDLSQNRWLITTITDLEPVDVSIDPNHHMYDSNRFDNQASAPGISLFPVGSNTISDDSYTSVWVPYLFRRPGEATSIAVQVALFRYLQSGIFGKIEYSPGSKKLAFLMSYEHSFKNAGLASEFAILQTYSQVRTSKISLYSQPRHEHINAKAAVKYRQIVGIKESFHPTLSLGVDLNIPSPLAACKIKALNEVEHAPAIRADGIHYHRMTSLWTIPCSLSKKSSYTMRSFHGILAKQRGYLPYFSLFRVNQLDELGVRIDEDDLPLLDRVIGLNQDILLPFWLPFVEKAMILSNRLKFRIFHDIGGRSLKYHDSYEAAGLGFVLPFGGDIVGFGALTISKLSILGVLHSRKGTSISRKPRILFDLSGKF